MKKALLVIATLILLTNCNSVKKTIEQKDNPVTIANETLEYEIIIMDNGFETYLLSKAKPSNYYSESFLENKNRFYVITWNTRARNPLNYNNNIYENVIDYSPHIHYGLEVNYKLYNYFKFVEYKYGEKF